MLKLKALMKRRKLLDAGVDKNIVAKCADLSISELDKLLVKN